MTATLRVGLIGAGWIACEHLAVLTRREDARVVAVCDLDEVRARRAAGPAGARVYRDWEDLLDGEALDAVWICTPPGAHRPPAVAALERGMPVFLEKPVARALDDAAAIVGAAGRNGAVCAVGYQWHGLDVLDDVRAALTGQTVGLLVGRSIGPARPRRWFLDRAQGGGNLLERASHHIDLQRAVAGEVADVQATASTVSLARDASPGGDIDDAVALVLTFAHGGVGTIQVAWTRSGLPGIYGLDVAATEATLRLDLDPEFVLSGASRGVTLAARASTHPFERTIGRFLDAVRVGDRGAVFCTPADGERTLAVAVAGERALTSGTRVPVPGAPP